MTLRSLRFLAGILLASAGLPTAAAPTETEVRFRSDIDLAGTMVLPEGAGPFPAIVFVHGSGPMTRDGFRPYANDFARMGIASLLFDKRGAGKSAMGPESLEGMAGDALAALEFVEGQPRIDTRRVGFWGISQAGWVISSAMGRSALPDFAIVISGGGASPLESELFTWDNEFAKHGLKGTALATATKLARDYYSYYGGKVTRSDLLAAFANARAAGGALKEFADFLEPKLVPEDKKSLAAWVHDYQPRADIARIKVPMLILLGDRDREHPTASSAKIWRDALTQAGNKDVTIAIFPGAGHGIRMRDGFKGEGRPPFADGYREIMDGWLWRHVLDVE
jgi:hypothetical protein